MRSFSGLLSITHPCSEKTFFAKSIPNVITFISNPPSLFVVMVPNHPGPLRGRSEKCRLGPYHQARVNELRQRRGYNRATVAVANKDARVIWAVLTSRAVSRSCVKVKRGCLRPVKSALPYVPSSSPAYPPRARPQGPLLPRQTQLIARSFFRFLSVPTCMRVEDRQWWRGTAHESAFPDTKFPERTATGITPPIMLYLKSDQVQKTECGTKPLFGQPAGNC